MTCGIYVIENTKNNKKYIGQAINIEKRFTRHMGKLNSKIHPNPHLQSAWNIYGGDVFIFYILEEMEINEDALNMAEIFYIKKYYSKNRKFGYNMTDGGGGSLGLSPSKETRDKISIANFGRKQTKEQIEKGILSRIGLTRSEETKHKMSLSALARVRDRLKMGNSLSKTKLEKRKLSGLPYGVYKDKKKYIVIVTFDGKRITVGRTLTEKEGAIMYNDYIIKNNINRPLNIV